jgi:broad-specificity NMP kinase
VPGTGKSLTCGEVCSRTGFNHVDIGVLAKVNDLYDGWDEQYQCPILNEDKVRSCLVVSKYLLFGGGGVENALTLDPKT